MPTAEEHIRAARRAAPQFGLDPSDITVLSRSENVVCELTSADGARVVMRLHRPGYNTLDELTSEVQWVSALGESGVPVPTAIPTISGDYYTTIDVGGETRHVGVVDWVEGEPLSKPSNAVRDVVAQYSTVGALAASIRRHSTTWPVPEGFLRRRWDVGGLVGDEPLWGRFWEVDTLTPATRALFERARDHLHDELQALSTESDRFGLIHADLHLGNLMADGQAMTVIDFDDAGWGWFAHEIAVALHPVVGEPHFDACRQAFLDGYRSVHPLDPDEAVLIDTFLTIRCLMLVGWLDTRRDLPHYRFADHLASEAEAAAERRLAT